jgi:glycosyltransferase involved in cell wall biosynthesis
MAKKKLLFMLGKMNVGGVEKAFLSMLEKLPPEVFDIHLVLLDKSGGFLASVPEYVTIHEVQCYMKNKEVINEPSLKIIKALFVLHRFVEAFVQMVLYVIFKATSNRYLFYQYVMRNEPMLPGEYDVAIAYAGPSQTIDWYVCRRVQAKVKCGWIHFDISKFGIDKGMTRKLYKDYKKIFVVSETAKDIFVKTFPQFSDKTEVFLNIVSKKNIERLAREPFDFTDKYNGVRILTVGRISPEKGQNVAIEALKILRDKGADVKWYFVGNGAFRKACEAQAVELGVEEFVTFLGTQVNPYPYMAHCDIYMQPSRHEGYCITLAEARCFGAPIVATNFTGAREQLSTRKNGVVVDMDAVSIAQGVLQAMTLPRMKTEDMKNNESNNIDKILSLLV